MSRMLYTIILCKVFSKLPLFISDYCWWWGIAEFGEHPNLFNSHYFSKRLIQCAEPVNFVCNYGLNYDFSSPDNKKHGTNNLKCKRLNVYHGSNFYVSDHICGPQEFRWQLKMHSHIMWASLCTEDRLLVCKPVVEMRNGFDFLLNTDFVCEFKHIP